MIKFYKGMRASGLAPSAMMLIAALLQMSGAHAADTVSEVPFGTVRNTAFTLTPGIGDTATLNIKGAMRPNTSGWTNIYLQGGGAGMVQINNDGMYRGRFDLSAATGDIHITNRSGRWNNDDPSATHKTAGWFSIGENKFGSGNDVFINEIDGVLALSSNASSFTTFDFGAGNDRFVNVGTLALGISSASDVFDPKLPNPIPYSFLGLETFENSGTILLGSSYPYGRQIDGRLLFDDAPDGMYSQRWSMPGTDFVGNEGSRLMMDFDLTAGAQVSCADLTAADCFDLAGGTTSGQTRVFLNNVDTFDQLQYRPEGIVLIDVSGGDSAAEHFVLDPQTTGYIEHSIFGGAMKSGLFVAPLVYNPDSKQHILYSVVDREAYELSSLGVAAQSMWYSSATSAMDRQATRRDDAAAERGVVWGGLMGEFAQRDRPQNIALGSQNHAFDASYQQDTTGLAIGADYGETVGEHGRYLLGVTGAYLESQVDFDSVDSRTDFSGGSLGFYGSYAYKAFFVDALVNTNFLSLDYDARALRLQDGTFISMEVESLGAQLESGWRFDIGSVFFAEPRVGVAWVRSQFDGFVLEGATVSYTDIESLRGHLGLRVGADTTLGGAQAQYALTARLWKESDGRSLVSVTKSTDLLSFADEVKGNFSELVASVNVAANDTGLSAYVDAGFKFNSDYHSSRFAAGVRYEW
jgi:hypothetical protein